MHTVQTLSEKRFQARENETLLDAALRQGTMLDHSCRTGRCSTCKGRVVRGDTTALSQELGLSADDIARGFVLTCVRQARSDITLDIEALNGIQLPEVKTQPCRIQTIESLAGDIVRVVLRLPPNSALQFLPGQYIDVIGPQGLRRSYSIANAPQPDAHLELHIRQVMNGAMSRYWFQQAKVNDLLRIRGPLGTFFLRDQAGKDLVLLATGTGIAPVKAILEGIAQTPAAARPNKVTVYWGGRQRQDIYWHGHDSNTRFVPVLSRADDTWDGARGYVQQVMLKETSSLQSTLVYACGSEAMIRDAQALLIDHGLPPRQFHSDAFVCSAPS